MHKIIRIEDLHNKSIDEIVNLYSNGFRLEEIQNQTLQSPTPTTNPLLYFTIGSVFLVGIVSGFMIMLLTRKK